jgi:hypothetical protein
MNSRLFDHLVGALGGVIINAQIGSVRDMRPTLNQVTKGLAKTICAMADGTLDSQVARRRCRCWGETRATAGVGGWPTRRGRPSLQNRTPKQA